MKHYNSVYKLENLQAALPVLILILFSFIGNKLLAQTTSLAVIGRQSTFFEDDNPLYLVDIGDANLALRYRKGEGVPIVFIHGSWDDHHSWLPVAIQVSSQIKNPIIIYDRRGHSASTPDKEQGSISQDVNDALLLVNVLGFDKAHFIGHSYGANIALQLAIQYPEKAESIVLYEPPAFGLLKGIPQYKEDMTEIKTEMAKAKALLEKGEIEKGTIHFIEKVAFGVGSWENIFDERARSTMIASYRTWLDQSNDPERLNIQPQKLNGFRGEITIISGNASLPIYPAVTKELFKKVTTVELEIIDGAGHGGLLSHSQETSSIIIKHLKNEY